MAMASVSRSAFSRTGTVLTMKPGVQTLSVGTIDVTGITIDTNYSIDTSSGVLQFTDTNGTRNFSFTEDIISGGLIKPELMPDRALTQVHLPADTDALLLLPTIQIGDIAIKGDNNFVYIAKNGDNEDIDDWQVLALASTHPSYEFVAGDKTVLDNLGIDTTAHFTAIDNPHTTNLGNLTSVSGGYTYTPDTTDKDDIGVAHATPGTQKRMEKIVSKEFSFGYNDNALENTFVEWKIPEQDWTHVYSFLTTGSGNTEYSIARLEDIPGGSGSSNLTPIFEGNETNEGGGEGSTLGGGVIQIGNSDNTVQLGDTLGTIEFYTKDSSFTQIDPGAPGGDSFVNLPLHVHAKISAESTSNYDNTQTAIAGQSALSRQGVDSEGVNTNFEDVFYQKDASIHFFTGRQNAIQKNFSVFHDGSLGIKPIDFSSNGTDLSTLEPIALTGITKMFANATDNSLYLYNKSGTDIVKNKLIYGETVTVPTVGDPVITYSNVQFQDVTANDITASEIDVTTLKVGGLEIDLDNLITEYDYWSESANELEITDAGVSFTGTETKDIVIPALGSLIPTDADLLDVVVLVRWRLTSNSDVSNPNTVQGGTVTIKKSDNATEYGVFTFVTGSYFTPASASAGGDMLIRSATIPSLTAFKALIGNTGATFNLLLNNITSEYNNLSLRDFSWGIRLYWR